MKFYLGLFVITLLFSCKPNDPASAKLTENKTMPTPPEYVIVIHGGAGTILKKNMTPELEQNIKAAMNTALEKGESTLQNGGSALDAVVETIKVLEDAPYFNAGKGAVFTHEGKNEMDASIMNGKDLDAGAVGGVTTVKNPITAARAVMENSPHVMLSGAGANTFSKEQGLEIVDPKYFYTEKRWNSLQRVLEKESQKVGQLLDEYPDYKYGTVGCAVLDRHGNLAAGTSTGGMTNKRWGRIGDAPIIGAGTYANNNTCAISATGHGEYFIRYAVTHDISARMEHGNVPFQEAADVVINDVLKKAEGNGGVIGVDKYGNVAMPFNTPGMYRAYLKAGGEKYFGMYKD